MKFKKLLLFIIACAFIFGIQQVALTSKAVNQDSSPKDNIFFEVTQSTVRAPSKTVSVYVIASDIDSKKDTKLKKQSIKSSIEN